MRRKARDSVGRNRQNDPRGITGLLEFPAPFILCPPSDSHAYHPDRLRTKYPHPLLSGRRWELLNIYEASRPLVLLWVLGNAYECVPAQGDPKPGKGTATQRLAAQFPGPEESKEDEGWRSCCQERNKRSSHIKERTEFHLCLLERSGVGRNVSEAGDWPARFPSRK